MRGVHQTAPNAYILGKILNLSYANILGRREYKIARYSGARLKAVHATQLSISVLYALLTL
jgi:hypothetical protein